MPVKNLVIVESPAKAKTIEKFLGKDFTVKSSFGHIRDLPKKGMSIDIDNNFTPTYEVAAEKKKTVAELKKAAKSATAVWLATDEDREGEAIAWHLAQALGLDLKTTKRIVFHEITKPAILKAIEKPRTVDGKLVDAQQARRVLDRLVGYELSPVLWKKVRRGLSAGRVQSVAVRLIVEREREIEKFATESTFKLTAQLKTKAGEQFSASRKENFKDDKGAEAFLETLSKADLHITDVEQKPGIRRPSPPFTTSTLQQAASRLGYSVKQTMVLAQRLYEAGHITYMRTDSLNLSETAINAARETIISNYGEQYAETRRFKTKSAGAQEAHEAIRPTNFTHEAAGQDAQQQKLYKLIRNRALASQMADAKTLKTKATIGLSNSKETLLAEGEVITFDGFLKVMGKQDDDKQLPDLKKDELLKLISAEAFETFSRPPARFTEASLVKKLEEMGIGRPSTYAPTISTVQDRGYIVKGNSEGEERTHRVLSLEKGAITASEQVERTGSDKGKLLPTDIAGVVTDFLVKYFEHVIDYDFTREVEAEFDQIAHGKQAWTTMIGNFYKPFHKTIASSEEIARSEVAQARVLGTDPKTGKPVTARFGRYGPMIQIGDAEDEEKPKFAPLPAGAKIDTVTFDEAMKMFNLPRTVGATTEGEEIVANIGRFGPYVKVGSMYVSIKPEDPFTVTEEKARELITAKKEQEANKYIQRFEEEGIDVLNGRYGPYITDGSKNAKIPKDTDPKKLTLKECQNLLKEAPAKGKRRFTKKTTKKKTAKKK